MDPSLEQPLAVLKVGPKQKRQLNFQRILEEAELPLLEIENVVFSTSQLYNSEVLNGNTPILIYSTKNYGANSINDPRLGIISANEQCQTCNLTGEDCLGHLGLIKLAQPIINPLFVTTVIDILSTLCRGCGRPLIPQAKIKELGLDKLPPKELLTELQRLSVKQEYTCSVLSESDELQCSVEFLPYRYKRDKDTLNKGAVIYNRQYQDEKGHLKPELGSNGRVIDYRMPIWSEDLDKESVKRYLDSIEDEYAQMIGFDVEAGSHPRNLVIKYLKVMPPCSRTNSIVNGIIKMDKLGNQYINIIKVNNNIQKMMEANADEDKIVDMTGKLFEMIQILFLDKSDKSHFKSITTLLKSKKGLLRGKMLGTRSDQTGRSVAVNDSDLRFNQVRIPASMAQTLTYPVLVTNENKDYLTKLLRQNKIVSIDPSTTSIFSKYHYTRKRVNKKMREQYNLTVGDVVNRHLQNGDYVIVNRQPTLHAAGMLGMEVVLAPPGSLTIGVNVMATSPFNLDFDGDELNIHVPQTLEAQEQVKNIMSIQNCLRSGEHGKLNFVLTYKSLETLAELTRDATEEDPEIKVKINDLKQIMGTIFDNFSDITTTLTSFERRLKKHQLIPKDTFLLGDFEITGKLLFSLVLPETLFYRRDDVIIEDGLLLQGVITKKYIGSAHGSISDVIENIYGGVEYMAFLQSLFFLLNEWGRTHSLSVGYSDCLITNPESQELLYKTVSKIRADVRQLRLKLGNDPFENEKIEQKIIEQIDKFNATGTRIIDQESKRNPFVRMEKSGAKGSKRNYMKIASGFGQVYSLGGIPKPQMARGERYTPYQFADVVDLEDTGFTADPLSRGLGPVAMFYNQLSGIEGLLKGITKTPESGKIFRELRIYLNSLTIHPDGSVRDAFDNIIQATYGNDNFEASKIVYINEGSVVKAFFTFVEVLANKVNAENDGPAKILNPKQIEDILTIFDPVKSSLEATQEIISHNFKLELQKKLERVQLTSKSIDPFKKELLTLYLRNQVQVDRRVGSLASESLTGDLTQDALDGKKNTGTSKYRITPLDLLKEILSVTANVKSPTTTLYFKENPSFSDVYSKYTDLVQLSLDDVIKRYEEPLQVEFLKGSYETDWYNLYERLYNITPPESTWMLRTELDLELLYRYKLKPEEVCKVLRKYNMFECYLSPITEATDSAGNKYDTVYLDIFIIDANLKTTKEISELKASLIGYVYFKRVFIPTYSKEILIRGIKDIVDYMVDDVNLLDFFTVENLVGSNTWKLYINYGWLNYNFLEYNQIITFLKQLGLKILEEHVNYILVSSKERPSQLAQRLYSELNSKEMAYREAQPRGSRLIPPSILNGGDTIFRKYYATVTGHNFSEFLLHEYFDLTRTYSDSLHETQQYLGITAVRNLIIIRVQKIFDIADLSVDPRHILLLANYMVFYGDINKVGHYGAAKHQTGVFGTASLSKTAQVFATAALFGSQNPVTTTTAAVATGTRLKKYYQESIQKHQKEVKEMDLEDLDDFLENFDVMAEELAFDPEVEPKESSQSDLATPDEDISYLMIGEGVLKD